MLQKMKPSFMSTVQISLVFALQSVLEAAENGPSQKFFCQRWLQGEECS
jgi:hypothetical protein